jgi:predicted dehydrogenase
MPLTRRHFLSTAAAGPLAGAALQGQARFSPNDQVQIGSIGLGNRGLSDAQVAAKVPGVKMVAVADLYTGRRERAREVFGNGMFVTADYHEMLARKDVDAVIVTTPDHWHAQASIDAMKAGKDVYCEKPMVHAIAEGHAVIEAQKSTGRIMQVGSQRVSSIVYEKARELIGEGAIGKLNLIEAWWDRPVDNDELVFRPSIPPDASPSTIDWDQFVANTAKRPFDARRFFWWHNYRDYGTGIPGDLFVHLFSGVHFVLGSLGPVRQVSAGGRRFWNDGREIPDLMLAIADYPETSRHPAFNLSLRVNFEQGAAETSGFRFVGEKGILHVADGGVRLSRHQRSREPGYAISSFSARMQDEFLREYRKQYPVTEPAPGNMQMTPTEEFLAPEGYSDHLHHFQNFFTSVRSRRPVVEDPVFGLRAAGPALLANESLYEQKICTWDPQAMVRTA